MRYRQFFAVGQEDQEACFHPEAVINRLIRAGDMEQAEKYLPLLDLPIKERIELSEKR